MGIAAGRAAAQSLEPRAYSPNPVGANFALANYAYQTGDVVFDASIPITDVSAKINIATLGYVRTFGLFGRSASAALAVPYAWGSVEGQVQEEQRRITRSGFADLQTRLTVNLLGGPAMTPGEFAARTPETTLGFTLVTVAPTGQYFPDKLINLGANRWAFKTELGFSQPAGKWAFEAYAGGWFFTPNDDFFGGQRPDAGAHLRVPGPRQLHLPAAPVARRERHLLHRRRDEPRRCAPPGPAEELPGEPHRLRAARSTPVDQALLVEGRDEVSRGELHDLQRVVPDSLVRPRSDAARRSTVRSAG